MLLRSVCFSTAGCNMLILQSPWIPILQEHGHDLVQTLREKNIKYESFVDQMMKIVCRWHSNFIL